MHQYVTHGCTVYACTSGVNNGNMSLNTCNYDKEVQLNKLQCLHTYNSNKTSYNRHKT